MTASQHEPNKPARDARGRLLKGSTANPGGRPALPDWFRDRGPSACAMLLAAATGVVVKTDPEADKAVEDMAKECPANLRLNAAVEMREVIYGKTPQPVELSPDENPLLAALVALAQGAKKPEEP